MIRARHGDVVILGIDAENVRRLCGGEPIAVDFANLGGPANSVVIVYGETMQDIVEKFKQDGILPPIS